MSDFFKTRCTGNEDGSYTLSYGKGAKKLVASMVKDGSKFRLISPAAIGDGPPLIDLKRKVITAWSAWAAAAYGNEGETPATDSPAAMPSLPAPRSGPPIYRPPEPLNGPQYVMRTHEPNTVFEYVGGFAVIDRAAGEQVAWCKYEQEATAILERNNAWNETSETEIPDDRSPEDSPQLGVSGGEGVDPGV